ncbi:MAG: VapC toxin family PIN domain ribonuclease [Actinobacteria bacterium 69-20]|nr:PIN domain-containing protein [Actinomycetota bacterium]OJV24557.1 MAG: VapC toxin family PIN domain ribonuclease [Actinobacteria bacterium 69-20]
MALADVNVLVAWAWPDHRQHSQAQRWFERERSRGWATTPITQSGFVRISSNRAVAPSATTPAAALRVLTEITSVSGHVFWPDDLNGVVGEPIAQSALIGYRQVTDAHLLSLAHRHGGRLVTFDARLRSLLKPGFEHLVEVVA